MSVVCRVVTRLVTFSPHPIPCTSALLLRLSDAHPSSNRLPLPSHFIADKKTQELLNAVLDAKLEDIDGGTSGAKLLRLRGHERWMRLIHGPLFVRSFYEDCVRGAMDNLRPGGRFAIGGNEGSELRVGEGASERESCGERREGCGPEV